jgi:hypothetical protein
MKIGVLATGGHNSKPANYKPNIGTFARRHDTAFSRLTVSAKKNYSRHSRAQGRIAMAASFVSIAIRWRSTTYRSIDRYHRAIDSHLSLCCDRRCVLYIALDRCERHLSCEGATMTHLEERVYAATAHTVKISALVGERWKASVACARIPTPDAATSMLRSTWSKSDRSRMWPARVY